MVKQKHDIFDPHIKLPPKESDSLVSFWRWFHANGAEKEKTAFPLFCTDWGNTESDGILGSEAVTDVFGWHRKLSMRATYQEMICK